jgi:hypothetical protein
MSIIFIREKPRFNDSSKSGHLMIFQIFSPQLNATQVCEESLQNRTIWKKIQNKRRLKALPHLCTYHTLPCLPERFEGSLRTKSLKKCLSLRGGARHLPLNYYCFVKFPTFPTKFDPTLLIAFWSWSELQK